MTNSVRGTIDARPAIALEAFVFARSEDWKIDPVQSPEGKVIDHKISPVPGTWYVYHNKERPITFTAVCCPNCKVPSLLHRKVTQIDGLGKMTPDFRCPTPRCGFARKAYLDMWNRKPLYACAILRNGKTPEVLYCHGSNQADARRELGMSITKNDIIVALGQAVGHFAQDNHGEKMVADASQLKGN